MVAQEKAKELVEKMRQVVFRGKNSKQCAVIAVDELIAGILSVTSSEKWQRTTHENETLEYWQKVKTEIENL